MVGAASEAELPAATAVVEPSDVELGRPFVLTLSVLHPLGSSVRLPDDLQLGDAIIESQRESDPTRLLAGSSGRETTFRITLLAFDTFATEVPAIAYEYHDATGTHERHSSTVALRVKGLVDTSSLALRPSRAPVDVPVRNWRLVAFVAGVGLLTVVALLVRRVRRRRPEPLKATAPVPPDLLAHQQLDELEASGRLDGGDQKEVFLRLSEILRGYLGRRFDFPALDLTTSEIRSRLRSCEDSRSWLGAVTDWLQRCDLVKYANSPSDTDEARQALYTARILVDRTKEVDHEQPREIARA